VVAEQAGKLLQAGVHEGVKDSFEQP